MTTLALLWLAASSMASAADPDPPLRIAHSPLVWTWSEGCTAARRMRVALSVDGHRVFQRTISICRIERGLLDEGRMSTNLRTEKSHFEEPPGTPLEVDFWHAGADDDAFDLGISFASTDQVWCNTIHVAFANKPWVTELAPGVVVRTYPLAGP